MADSKLSSDSKKPRTAPKQQRQRELIKATIRSIATHGLAATTIATVAREAKLSQGIINLHFQSKQRLLVATLEHLSNEYRDTWRRADADAGSGCAQRLQALAHVDFERPICERNKLAVWFAFWGESKSRPIYRKLCSEIDDEYRATVAEVCRELIIEGGYDHDWRTVARGLSSMGGGLWLSMLMDAGRLDREGAKIVIDDYLAGMFPKHFSSAGASQ